MCVYGTACTAYACCTLMHQGPWACMVCAERDWGGRPSALRPTPYTTARHSPSQAGRAAGQSGRLSCRVARNVQPTCPPALPQVLPSGWCQWVSRLP